MSHRISPAVLVTALVALVSCSQGTETPSVEPGVPFVLAAGSTDLRPVPTDAGNAGVPLQRLDVESVDAVYELSTPAGLPFSFDVLTRAAGGSGPVFASMAHVLDGAAEPLGGPESMARAGLVLTATGTGLRGQWFDATGDGFARITVNGSIHEDQVIVVRTAADAGTTTRLIRIEVGEPSVINIPPVGSGDHPGIVDAQTVYSSDAWGFGLPTIAVSGDRTSIVVYEGDRSSWNRPERYELRLQHDTRTRAVTGGGSEESNPDSGHWRDHEIAALFNVLALAHCGDGKVTLDLSFDRGATFAQTFEVAAENWATRLVQVAIAADYSLALVYARSPDPSTGMELVLVEGRPDAFDGNGSPTRFALDPPQVLHRAPRGATPLLCGVTWSDGGDLVIGYAFNWVDRRPDATWANTTEFRCATRYWGQEFVDVQVDLDVVVGRDPSVAVVGTGAAMRIFYAYEGPDGVRLRVSSDGGATWSLPETVGSNGANTPTVFARELNGLTRVDLLYLAFTGSGTELHASRWDDFDTTHRADYRLTTAVMTPSAGATDPLNPSLGPITEGQRLTQVAWFGYDAVRDGDEIVVVYDEETFDAVFACAGAMPMDTGTTLSGSGTLGAPSFRPAEPPPLSAGMTQVVPAPDPRHRHQLELIRIR